MVLIWTSSKQLYVKVFNWSKGSSITDVQSNGGGGELMWTITTDGLLGGAGINKGVHKFKISRSETQNILLLTRPVYGRIVRKRPKRKIFWILDVYARPKCKKYFAFYLHVFKMDDIFGRTFLMDDP